MIQKHWLMCNTNQWLFLQLTSFSTHLFGKDWFDPIPHYQLRHLISLPLPTKASNKAPAFDLHSPWVKRYAATNPQPTIREHISDEVTQTASQPDDYSILKSFQIKSRVIIFWWLKREQAFVSKQISFLLKLRRSDCNFTSSTAAEMKLLKAQMTRSDVLFGLNKTLL